MTNEEILRKRDEEVASEQHPGLASKIFREAILAERLKSEARKSEKG
jgi:hypothetical protein